MSRCSRTPYIRDKIDTNDNSIPELVSTLINNQGKVMKYKLKPEDKVLIDRTFGLTAIFELENPASDHLIQRYCIQELTNGIRRIDLPFHGNTTIGIAESCHNLFLGISRDVLDEISVSINEEKESLSSLLGTQDDQSILSLYHYPSGSYCDNHEDRGLLTFVFSPDDKSLRDVFGYPVNLKEDELAVIVGAALEEATKRSADGVGYIKTAKHSVSTGNLIVGYLNQIC